ncbi:MAG: NAD(P)/FAD-dependent oxidoreductase [Hyphomicrobiales bacterium]
MADIETVVVGAGVIGLAVGRALALSGQEGILIERHGLIGSETSARNSEVIHAGIYYPQGSLKARLCVAGKKMLYEYCERHGVGHARTGKLIVASDESQAPDLKGIQAAARGNSVNDLELLGKDDVAELEPELSAAAALLSPSTGIIDTHAFMLSLQGEIENCGGTVAFNSQVLDLVFQPDGGFLLRVSTGGTETYELTCERLVLAAGLQCSALASKLLENQNYAPPPTYMAKGNYFSLQAKAPFSRLIYPVPEPGGLGVHLTLDLAGRARFGPDVEWVETENYEVDPRRAEAFYGAIRKYWPALPDGSLAPDYSGIRPKIAAEGKPNADFEIHGEKEHGVRGLVCLYGIESPGLTSSLAIAEYVQSLMNFRTPAL